MKKFKVLLIVIISFVVLVGFMIIYNPKKMVGYNGSSLENELNAQIGMYFKKSRFDVSNDIPFKYSLGYLESSEHEIKCVRIYTIINEEKKIYLEEDITCFYSENYICYQTGLFKNKLTYKYSNQIELKFSELNCSGEIVVEIVAINKYAQEIIVSRTMEFEIYYGILKLK